MFSRNICFHNRFTIEKKFFFFQSLKDEQIRETRSKGGGGSSRGVATLFRAERSGESTISCELARDKRKRLRSFLLNEMPRDRNWSPSFLARSSSRSLRRGSPPGVALKPIKGAGDYYNNFSPLPTPLNCSDCFLTRNHPRKNCFFLPLLWTKTFIF